MGREVQKQEPEKIDLRLVFDAMEREVRKHFFAALLIIAFCMLASYVFNCIFYVSEYEAYATFSIHSDSEENQEYGDVDASELKETMPYLLKTDLLKDQVMDDLGIVSFPYKLSLNAQDSVNLFTLSVRGDNPKETYRVLESTLDHIPIIGRYVFGNLQFDVMDESGVPKQAVNDHSTLEILLRGCLIGIFICIITAFVFSMRTDTIHTEEEWKKCFHVPCLSVVPNVTFKRRKKKVDQSIQICNSLIHYPFLEAFHTIAFRLEREAKKKMGKSILVTSSIPEEGKSTMSVNIALALAKRGKKVVILDCDFRNPSIGKVLGIDQENVPSMIDLWNKKSSLEDAVCHYDKGNIDLIFAGVTVKNPMEKMKEEDVQAFIHELKKEYDYIVMDTPPAAMLTDASNFAKFMDGVVYVVRKDHARIGQIKEGMTAIMMSNTPIYGCILNRGRGV